MHIRLQSENVQWYMGWIYYFAFFISAILHVWVISIQIKIWKSILKEVFIFVVVFIQDVNFLSFILVFFLTSILNFFPRTGWVWVNIAFTFFHQLIFSLNIHTFIGRICDSINCILLLIFPFRCIIVGLAFFHFMLGYWFIYTIGIDYVIIISQGWCCSSKNYIVHTHTLHYQRFSRTLSWTKNLQISVGICSTGLVITAV